MSEGPAVTGLDGRARSVIIQLVNNRHDPVGPGWHSAVLGGGLSARTCCAPAARTAGGHWTFTLASLAALMLLGSAAARATAPGCDAYPSADSPALAAVGQFAIGRRIVGFDVPDVPDLARADPVTGNIPVRTRRIEMLVWYPAAASGCGEHTLIRRVLESHPWRPLPQPHTDIDVPSAAIDGAAARRGGRYPIVVLSHGMNGWAGALAYLGEHLASHGYVAVSIEHDDTVDPRVDPLRSAAVFRPRDQLAAIAALRTWSADPRHFLGGVLDTDRIAIVGYSMGGYGALNSGGAGFNAAAPVFQSLPKQALRGRTASDPDFRVDPGIRAIVAIAPWGGQPGVGAFDAASLSGMRTPLLFIAGDHDHISGYADGIGALFRATTGTERWMLVYENARHNVAGYPIPAFASSSYGLFRFFAESSWRSDRVVAINRHFVTAFLDLVLKDEEDRRVYLEPPVTRSSDGIWPTTDGRDPGERVADPAHEPGFWPGFQRLTALGLQLHHLRPKPPDSAPGDQ